MSGHSRWHNIRLKKTKMDAIRGKMFAKCIREITVAARAGGGDPDANPRLRAAVEKAKEINMPQDNIQRAIQKGTGELPGVQYEEFFLEGYGPGGVALYIHVTTDNRQRAVSEIRRLLSRQGGSLGEAGCTAWIFERKGTVTVADKSEDEVLQIALEGGADDVKAEGDGFLVTVEPEQFEAVCQAFADHGVEPSSAEVTFVPKTTVVLDKEEGRRMLKLMEALEECDEVQNIYANFDVPDEVLAEAG